MTSSGRILRHSVYFMLDNIPGQSLHGHSVYILEVSEGGAESPPPNFLKA